MPVSVKDYGAVGNGITDDTLAIQTAINAASEGDCVVFPVGVYKTSSVITISKRLSIEGNRSKIKIISNGIRIIYSDTSVEGLVFEGTRQSLNNCGLIIEADKVLVKDCDFTLTSHSIRVLSGTWHTLSRIRGRNITTGFIEIGNVVGTVVEDARYDTDVATYPQPQYGIWLYGEGCNISDIDLIRAGKCIYLQCVTTRDNTWNFFNSCSLDTSDYGLYVENKTSKSLNGQMFDQCWFSSHNNAGIYVEGTNINGINFSDSVIINNKKEGVILTGSADNITFNNCTFSANSSSFPRNHHHIYSNCSGKKYITNNKFCNWGGFVSSPAYDLLRAEQDGPCVLDGNISMGQNGGGYVSGSSVVLTLGKNFGNLPSS